MRTFQLLGLVVLGLGVNGATGRRVPDDEKKTTVRASASRDHAQRAAAKQHRTLQEKPTPAPTGGAASEFDSSTSAVRTPEPTPAQTPGASRSETTPAPVAVAEKPGAPQPTLKPTLGPTGEPLASEAFLPGYDSYTSSTIGAYPDCHVDIPQWIGDGWCDADAPYNTAECGYDGGDCCECSCTDDRPHECGVNAEYHCVDPVNQPGLCGCDVPIPGWIGDGWCDSEAPYNTPECMYDGGDCCECSCTEDRQHPCGTNAPFACLDPDNQDESCACQVPNPHWIGDGWCDSAEPYNTAECMYDGGDCCKCSCTDDRLHTCGANAPFLCLDPDNQDDTCGCQVPNPHWIGDGWCDSAEPYNTAECMYDGGDCCECSCSDDRPYDCGANAPFLCLDPENQDESCACEVPNPSWIGDGWCDSAEPYNTPNCDYDGGDCCKCSCTDDRQHPCGVRAPFSCQDPDNQDDTCDMSMSFSMDFVDWS